MGVGRQVPFQSPLNTEFSSLSIYGFPKLAGAFVGVLLFRDSLLFGDFLKGSLIVLNPQFRISQKPVPPNQRLLVKEPTQQGTWPSATPT